MEPRQAMLYRLTAFSIRTDFFTLGDLVRAIDLTWMSNGSYIWISDIFYAVFCPFVYAAMRHVAVLYCVRWTLDNPILAVAAKLLYRGRRSLRCPRRYGIRLFYSIANVVLLGIPPDCLY